MRRTLILLIVIAVASVAQAKVDLVTLPSRETVQLTIYNSADMTLVRESRDLTLKNGETSCNFRGRILLLTRRAWRCFLKLMQIKLTLQI